MNSRLSPSEILSHFLVEVPVVWREKRPDLGLKPIGQWRVLMALAVGAVHLAPTVLVAVKAADEVRLFN